MKSVLVIAVFSVCWFLTESVRFSQHCDVSPALWCSSRTIARACQVESQCEANVWSRSKPAEAPPVNFTLYLEFFCPACRDFFDTQLSPTFLKIGSIMNLELVPYGNAGETYESGKWVFTCQHGPPECLGNLVETCAIHVLGSVGNAFPFINCLEKCLLDPSISGPECAKVVGIDYKDISDCVNGPLGNQLEHEMAKKTESLNPPHRYVPWVTLNGVHTEEIEDQALTDLLKLICDTYTGTKPAACQEDKAVQKCLKN